jgi:hypothetical protein
MSDLGLQPREVWKQPDRLPAEGRLVVQKTQARFRVIFFVACLALFEYLPLAWYLETSNLTRIDLIIRFAFLKEQALGQKQEIKSSQVTNHK